MTKKIEDDPIAAATTDRAPIPDWSRDETEDIRLELDSGEPVIGRVKEGSFYFVLVYGEPLGKRYELEAGTVAIGRAPDCDIRVQDTSVSRLHCEIVRDTNTFTLVDNGSTNRTYVNGKPVKQVELRDGDLVRVGRSIFKLLAADNVEAELFTMISTDALTGARNKRYFDSEIRSLIAQNERDGDPMSLVMIDIDHFKSVNDNHGHLFGDRVLARLGELTIAQKRPADLFCRLGGEEFCLVLPRTTLEEAVEVAERLRQKVMETTFTFEDRGLSITISQGVSIWDRNGMKLATDLVKAADKALYVAKDTGRNKVVTG